MEVKYLRIFHQILLKLLTMKPYKLIVTDTQRLKLCKGFTNDSSDNMNYKVFHDSIT